MLISKLTYDAIILQAFWTTGSNERGGEFFCQELLLQNVENCFSDVNHCYVQVKSNNFFQCLLLKGSYDSANNKIDWEDNQDKKFKLKEMVWERSGAVYILLVCAL